ncbi:MAG TPA: hypothetical protein VEF04_17310 [Blastocatellia bacterium]|nr:hypothetical protein [Blastocatellia bacterium]
MPTIKIKVSEKIFKRLKALRKIIKNNASLPPQFKADCKKVRGIATTMVESSVGVWEFRYESKQPKVKSEVKKKKK